MSSIAAVDEATGRKFYLDDPDDLRPGEPVTFLLNLHGGGSVGQWQHAYFPAHDFKEQHRLVIATPSAATKEPSRRWVAEADDEHLKHIVHYVFEKYGVGNIRSFWLVGHSQGGQTSARLLQDAFFRDRVDGWLSLSGGRLGGHERPDAFFLPVRGTVPPPSERPAPPPLPDTDLSFIFAIGEHEIVTLPETSPWAEKYGAGPKQRLADVVDTEAGQIYDRMREGKSNASWGLEARPGTAQVYVYPNARGGRVIADVLRLDKGHTEGLEPNVMRTLIEMLVSAPGGKAKALLAKA